MKIEYFLVQDVSGISDEELSTDVSKSEDCADVVTIVLGVSGISDKELSTDVSESEDCADVVLNLEVELGVTVTSDRDLSPAVFVSSEPPHCLCFLLRHRSFVLKNRVSLHNTFYYAT